MQYQTIVDLIRDTAIAALEAVKPEDGVRGSVFHLRNADFTLQNDAPFPQIKFELGASKPIGANGTREFQVSFLFCDQESEGSSETEKEAIYNRMARLNAVFFNLLNDNDYVQVVIANDVEATQNFQARASGYGTACAITGHFQEDVCTELIA